PELRDPFLLKIGEAVKIMHTLPVVGYGQLIVASDGSVRGKYDDWETAALAAVEPGLAKLESNAYFNNDLLSLARTIVADHKSILSTLDEGKLLHGDFGLVHFYGDLETGELTGMIDFGECKSGDPVWDFVDFSWKYMQTIVNGYGIGNTDEGFGPFKDKFYYYCLLRDLVWTVRFNEKWTKDAAERMEYVITAVAKHFGYLDSTDQPKVFAS
ncbi:MAG: phosphotransferase, partial [Chloroflexota bacterium]